MIEIFIFHIHIVAAVYAFTLRWKEENTKEGFLALAMIGVTFSILWAITGSIARIITPQNGFTSWFTSDTLSLVLLLILEIPLFLLFFKRKENSIKSS